MPQQRHFISLLTALLFLFHTLLPFFAVYDTSALANLDKANERVLFGDKILICTQDGFDWVTPESVAGKPDKSHKKSPYQCALCYIAAKGQADSTLFNASPITVSHEIALFSTTLHSALFLDRSAQYLNHPTRAPPLVV